MGDKLLCNQNLEDFKREIQTVTKGRCLMVNAERYEYYINALFNGYKKYYDLYHAKTDKVDGNSDKIELLKKEVKRLKTKCNKLLNNQRPKPNRSGRTAGSGKLADAMIVADRISGIPRKTILRTPYPFDKHGHKRIFREGKVDNALRCKSSEDVDRIFTLYDLYPKEFESRGVDRNAILIWCAKKSAG